MMWSRSPTAPFDPMDLIVGRLVRRFLACEGLPATRQTKDTLQAYVEDARKEAVYYGMDPAEVDRVASRLTVNVW